MPKYLLVIFLAAGIFSASAQSNSVFLAHADSALKKYNNDHTIEKVYLHLNKPSYYPGDTIWYKTYTVSGANRPSKLSGVMNVELINPKDSVVMRQSLKLVNGIAWSELSLSRDLSEGTYHIRAYTNWMRNQGQDYFYDRSIQIGAAVMPAAQRQITAAHPDVQFFPEGGELVNGLRSRVAFKAISSNGLGEDIKGTIEDNDGNVVADFASQHLGMGVFALMPQSGRSYHAKISVEGEASFTIDLPKARESGFTLSVDNRGRDSIYVKIAANNKLFEAQQNSTFYLTAQSRGRLYYATQGKLESQVFIARIAKPRLPSGIMQFTLFSAQGEPLNERIAFVLNDDTLKMKLANLAKTYAPRQEVNLELGSNADEDEGLTGSYSISVINESRIPADENLESTIINNLLLTSDLKGYVEQPNYYFTHINEQKQADLDILMQTQGYRRFEWKEVLHPTPRPVAYQAQKILQLEGLLKTPSGKPIPNGKVTLAAMKEGFVIDTTADAAGNFKFTDLNLSDTSKLVLRARTEHNGSNVAIYVKQPDYPAVTKTAGDDLFKAEIAKMNLTPEMLKGFKDYQQKQDSLKNGRQLKEVVIKGKKEAKPDIHNRYGTLNERFLDMKQMKGYPSLEMALNAQPVVINQLEIIKRDSRYFRDKVDSIPVILDGQFVYKTSLRAFRPEEIESVGLIDGPLLIVTTKRYARTDTTVLKSVMLNQVDIKARRDKPDLSNSSNLNGTGHYNYLIMGEKLHECASLYDCLLGKMPGVISKNYKFYLVRNLARSAVHSRDTALANANNPMAIIVDGTFFDQRHYNPLSFLNADDIYSIEVLTSGAYLAIYGSNASGGALIITTRRGGEDKSHYLSSAEPAGLITYPFKGFHIARTFYTPKYTHPKTNSDAPDLRSAIYWNPNITINDKGKAGIEFYNADTKGTYRIVVEGVDGDGNVGRAVYRYQVE